MSHPTDDVWDDWKQAVNMRAKELENWLGAGATR